MSVKLVLEIIWGRKFEKKLEKCLKIMCFGRYIHLLKRENIKEVIKFIKKNSIRIVC